MPSTAAAAQFNAFVAPDESYIVVSVFGRKDTLGSTDYYVVFRGSDDTWSQPLNLGEAINTAKGEEYSPYVSPDGKYFFFMSPRKRSDLFAPGETLTWEKLRRLHDLPGHGNPVIWWVEAGFLAGVAPEGRAVGHAAEPEDEARDALGSAAAVGARWRAPPGAVPVAHARRGIPPWALPATPFDRTNPDLADQWQFLREAIEHIPPGASYTVVAPDRETAMSVFMFSRALLPDRVARPTSYWDTPTPEEGAMAEFVLAYRRAPEAEPGLLVVGSPRVRCGRDPAEEGPLKAALVFLAAQAALALLGCRRRSTLGCAASRPRRVSERPLRRARRC